MTNKEAWLHVVETIFRESVLTVNSLCYETTSTAEEMKTCSLSVNKQLG